MRLICESEPGLKTSRSKNPDIPVAELRKAFRYDPETGVITRIRTGKKTGTVAGKGHRHLQVGYKGTRIYAHRLAWALHKGKWPPADLDIDHRDCDGQNNRWANLRLATRSQNGGNARLSAANTSGFKGVGKRGNRWRAYLVSGNVHHHLGYFDDAESAARAYDRKALEVFGEHARLNFPKPTEPVVKVGTRRAGIIPPDVLARIRGLILATSGRAL